MTEKLIAGIPEEELFAPGHMACAGCGCTPAIRHALKASGKDVIVVSATGCMEVVSSAYPLTSWRVPWIHSAFENSAAVASGVKAALNTQKKDTKVLVIAGDGGTFDIGLQALSGAVERGTDFCFICYDNGAYENTGVQRSGATPKFAWTTTTPIGKSIRGKPEQKKNMPFIIAAHNQNTYVATANIAYPSDYYKKVKKALEHNGPAYIQVFTPCVPGWKIPSNMSIEVAKKAFLSKITPLFEIEHGILKFTSKPAKQISVEEFTKMQGRFKHINDQELKEMQQTINEEFEKLEKLEKSKLRLF